MEYPDYQSIILMLDDVYKNWMKQSTRRVEPPRKVADEGGPDEPWVAIRAPPLGDGAAGPSSSERGFDTWVAE